MAARRFTAGGPTVPDGTPVWADIEIGYEHTIDDDGVLTYARDADGALVMKAWRLPLVVTARDSIEAIHRVTKALAKYGLDFESAATGQYKAEAHEDVMLALIDAMIGIDTVSQIARYPGVEPEAFDELMQHLLKRWDFDTLLTELFGATEGAEADPFG